MPPTPQGIYSECIWWTPVSLLVFKCLRSFPPGCWGGTCLRGAERDFRQKRVPIKHRGWGVQQPGGTLAGHIASHRMFSMKPWALVFLCYRSYNRRWGQWTGSSIATQQTNQPPIKRKKKKKIVASLLHCEEPIRSGEPVSVAYIHAEENEGVCGRHTERVRLTWRRKLKQSEQPDGCGSALPENSTWNPQQEEFQSSQLSVSTRRSHCKMKYIEQYSHNRLKKRTHRIRKVWLSL